MATINFNSNVTATGTAGNDSIVGIEPSTNNNDIVYGLPGNDTVTSDNELNNSTLYGGQGDDEIFANNGSALYGNIGNDVLDILGNASANILAVDDTLYGGQGNDAMETFFSSHDVFYGNVGDDGLELDQDLAQTAYGGQGNDDISAFYSASDALYGNQGNDALGDFVANHATSVLYGGQGDDSLAASASGGDTMFGGLGSDLFATNDSLAPNAFTANDLITVEDFVSGLDKLALSTVDGGPGLLFKESDPSASNAGSALSAADAFFSTHSASAQYLFVYGGSGAGYLFYNGDGGGSAANDGMTLVGDNAESSLLANDIIASAFAG